MTESNNFPLGVMTVKDLAEYMHKPRSTIHDWIRRGVIPEECYKRVGGTYFIKIKQIKIWLEVDE